MIYIDTLKSYPGHEVQYAHMTADSLTELHTYAQKLGLGKEWFHNVRHPHYDISEKLYALAVTNAKVVNSRVIVEKSKLLKY